MRTSPPPLPRRLRRGAALASGGGAVLAVAAVLALCAWIWYGWRIEPENGTVAVLMRKTGKDLPQGEILAPGPGYKGIQLDVLAEGRHFRNPITHDWRIVPVTTIPAGSVGIAGTQTGVYPIDSPGGWQLIGRTPVKMYDPDREVPILPEAGQYIKFFPVTQEEYDAILKEVEAGTYTVKTHARKEG